MAEKKVDKALEAARRKLGQLHGEGEGGFQGRRLEMGMNACRIFPRPDSDQFYFQAEGHYMGGQYVRCITKRFGGKNGNMPTIESECPLCRKYLQELAILNKTTKRGSDEAKAGWKAVNEAWAPKPNYYVRQFDPKSDEPELEILRFGSQILDGLLVEYVDAGIKFFSIEKGRTMFLKKKKKPNARSDKDIEYKVIRGKSRSDITDIWEQVKDELPSFEEAAGKKMKPEALVRLVEAYDVDLAPKAKKSKVRDEEEDDDEGDDEGDDDSEDD